MNWGTWVTSKYNKGGWKIDPSSYVISADNSKTVRDSSGGLAFYCTEIIKDEKYTTN